MYQVHINKNIKYILIILFFIICFSYLMLKSTYSLYESDIDVETSSELAAWNIKINNTEINGVEDGLDLSYTITSNAINNKVAPGSVLAYPITIDAADTDVAVKFELDITDKTIDSTKLLQIQSIQSNDITITRTSASKYTGVIPKSGLDTPVTINLVMEWPDDGSLVEYVEDDNDDHYFSIDFHALQYRGEAITPYS